MNAAEIKVSQPDSSAALVLDPREISFVDDSGKVRLRIALSPDGQALVVLDHYGNEVFRMGKS